MHSRLRSHQRGKVNERRGLRCQNTIVDGRLLASTTLQQDDRVRSGARPRSQLPVSIVRESDACPSRLGGRLNTGLMRTEVWLQLMEAGPCADIGDRDVLSLLINGLKTGLRLGRIACMT